MKIKSLDIKAKMNGYDIAHLFSEFPNIKIKDFFSFYEIKYTDDIGDKTIQLIDPTLTEVLMLLLVFHKLPYNDVVKIDTAASLRTYLQDAKDNEFVFRAILDVLKVNHEGLSVEDIYNFQNSKTESEWHISNFEKKRRNLYYISFGYWSFLAGNLRVESYKIIDGKAVRVKIINEIMS